MKMLKKCIAIIVACSLVASVMVAPAAATDSDQMAVEKTGLIELPEGYSIQIPESVKASSPVIDIADLPLLASSSYTLLSGHGLWVSYGQRPVGSVLNLNISSNSNSCGLSVQMYYGDSSTSTTNTYGENFTCYTINKNWTVNRSSKYWRVYIYNWGETSTSLTYTATYTS